MKTKKLIFSFLRINEKGTFEKVSWFFNESKKEVTKEPYKPSNTELNKLFESKYTEINL